MDVLSIRGTGFWDITTTFFEYLFEGKGVDICLNHDAKGLGLYDRETHWYRLCHSVVDDDPRLLEGEEAKKGITSSRKCFWFCHLSVHAKQL